MRTLHTGWILTATPLIVILVALASCYLPARTASHVDSYSGTAVRVKRD